jgi:tRNA threonylcarbamoyladenosine biosynthesis protein TsaB
MAPSGKIHILQINTAMREASVGIGVNGELKAVMSNPNQHDHAAFLHPAIDEVCRKAKISLQHIQAVAVMNGPGSYTGLRVGLSAAKGICFALNLPLICISTLDWMAFGNKETTTDMISPMIDARRMEVFTAVYSQSIKCLLPPAPMILDETSFTSLLDAGSISFIGDGAKKWADICRHPRAFFPEGKQNAYHFNTMAFNAFEAADYTDVSSAEPFYLKGFHSTQKPESKD